MIDPIHIHYTVLMRWTQWAPSLLRLPSCMNGLLCKCILFMKGLKKHTKCQLHHKTNKKAPVGVIVMEPEANLSLVTAPA